MFFSNIYFTNGIIYSEVRKYKISLPLEDFAEVLDLPHDRPYFKLDELDEDDNYMSKSDSSSFLLDLKTHVSSLFSIGSVHPHICLTHCVENHMLFPRRET